MEGDYTYWEVALLTLSGFVLDRLRLRFRLQIHLAGRYTHRMVICPA